MRAFIRASDNAEREALTRCICGREMEVEWGPYVVTLTCPVCREVREWTRAEWAAAYSDPMDDIG